MFPLKKNELRKETLEIKILSKFISERRIKKILFIDLILKFSNFKYLKKAQLLFISNIESMFSVPDIIIELFF